VQQVGSQAALGIRVNRCEAAARPLSLHEFGVAEALDQARVLGVLPARVVLIGMEPERLEPAMELSDTCARALPELIRLLRAEAGLA